MKLMISERIILAMCLFGSTTIHAMETSKNGPSTETRRVLGKRRQLKPGKSGGKSKIDTLVEYNDALYKLYDKCTKTVEKCTTDLNKINLEFQAIASEAMEEGLQGVVVGSCRGGYPIRKEEQIPQQPLGPVNYLTVDQATSAQVTVEQQAP